MSARAPAEYLFVYGTLRRDTEHPMAGVLAAASTYVGRGAYQGRLFRVSWYPGAIPSDFPQDRVIGDVFRIRDGRAAELFGMLDTYEGTTPEAEEAPYYRRERVRVRMGGGGEIEAWIYLFNRSTEAMGRIESGDFLAG